MTSSRQMMTSSLLLVVLTCSLSSVSGARCDLVSQFDHSEFFTCPGPWDDSDEVFCCGQGENSFCCSDPSDTYSQIGKGTGKNDVKGRDEDLAFDDEPIEMLPTPEKRSIVRGIAKLVAIVVGAAIFVLVVCVLCCCCCPFCILAKKRQRGEVLSQNNPDANQMQLPAQQVNPPPSAAMPQQQMQQPYPQQQMAYPPPQQPYGQQAYPPPQQPMMPPTGYPAQPPPYPGPPLNAAVAAVPEASPLQAKTEYQTQPSYNPQY